MKIQKLNEEQLKNKLTKVLDDYNRYLYKTEPIYSENESIYLSKFYKQYSSKVKGLIDIKKRFPWLVRVALNHTFTFIRLLQSKIVSNYPSVTVYPLSNEPSDKEASIAADNLLRYAREQYQLDEVTSSLVLNMLIYGTGFMSVEWDPNSGELLDIEEDGNVLMEGDVKLSVINPRNVYFDHNVSDWKDVRWAMIRKYMPMDQAKLLYPEHEQELQEAKQDQMYDPFTVQAEAVQGYTVVYEYWEKGLPENGMTGRKTIFTPSKVILEDGDNPYKPAELPLVILTDIDVPNKVMGKSIIDILRDPQKTLNRLMSQIMENVNTHGVIRIAVPNSAGIPEEAISDRPIDIIYYNGQAGTPPMQLQPANLPGHIFRAFDILVNMMEHIAGIRAFSRGEAPKALSGFAYQFLQEQDEKVLYSVHAKYKRAVVEIYWQMLERIKQFWTEERTITILGAEREYEYYRYAGTSLEGRYNIQIQHGTSIPNDPAARRQAILELYKEGLIEDKGLVLRLLEIGDIVGVFDTAKFAKKRQKEEIDIITKLNQPMDIREFEDHQAHLQELYAYQQSRDYYELPEELKALVDQHTQAHEAKVKELQGGGGGAAPGGAVPPVTGTL